MRIHLILLMAWGCFTLAYAVEAPVQVVELFTSEGCSSCPPADALINSLSAEGTVICLAFHVDYWNYLGWKDPWSSPQASARQQGYARFLGGGVYTPCAVVNGRSAVLGSDHAAIIQALAATACAAHAVVLSATWHGASVDLTASVAEAPASTTVLFALVESGLASLPTAGENRGARLDHDQVVRSFTSVVAASGTAHAQLQLAQGTLMQHIRIIALASAGRYQGVIGATSRAAVVP